MIRYVNNNITSIKNKCYDKDFDILKSALIYQYLHMRYFCDKIYICDILTLYTSVGDIYLCETIWCDIFNKIVDKQYVYVHTILRHAFLSFFKINKLSRGVMYFKQVHKTRKWSKKWNSEIRGILFCVKNNITL